MAPSQAAFVIAAREQLGLTQTAFGAELGEDNGYTMAHNWQTEKTALHYSQVIQILLRCGWLTEDARARLGAAEEALAAAQQAADAAEGQARRLRRRPPPTK